MTRCTLRRGDPVKDMGAHPIIFAEEVEVNSRHDARCILHRVAIGSDPNRNRQIA